MEYSQPDFYRFNQDSTKLIHFIRTHLTDDPQAVLDLGAGCGVLGLEFCQGREEVDLVLVEGQREFLPYLQENCQRFYPQAKIVHSLFSEFHSSQKFDLILSNPPYFLKGEGRESPRFEKQMARTWEKDSLEILLSVIQKSLSPKGEAWLSLRSTPKVLELLRRHFQVEIFNQSEELIYARLLA